MFDRLRKKLKEKEGFTLLEMVLTVGITAVLAGILSVGIFGYMTSAYMNRVNETAKTVFLATQSYLTQQKQLGKLSAFNETASQFGEEITKEQLKEIYLANDPEFSFEEYEKKYGTNGIRYILLEEGDGTTESENPIYQIVKEYIHDDDLLKHTFIVEYDTKSGAVRSVFYTELANTLNYNSDRAAKSNVVIRNDPDLKKKRQGYYGVDMTSLLVSDLDLLAPGNVKLVNGERLFVEWKEVNYLSDEDKAAGRTQNANEAFDNPALKEYLAYDIEVYRTDEAGDKKLFTLKDVSAKNSKGITMAEADQRVTDNGMVLSYKESSNTYQLVLDDIHHSIFDMYKKGMDSQHLETELDVMASDMLYCKISVHFIENSSYESQSDAVSTNLQSANFAGGAESFSPTGLDKDEVEVFGNGNLQEDGIAKEDGSAFSVANARQLNNMRNAADISCFVQTKDVDWSKPEIDRSLSAGLFKPLSFKVYTGSVEEAGIYKGVFRTEKKDKENVRISNLNIDGLTQTVEKNVGLFRENKGSILGIHLVNAKVQGAYQVGAVAGTNAGIISGAVLDNCSVQGSFYVGGVTGKNLAAGTLSQIECDAAATGNVTADITNRIVIPRGDEAEYGTYIGGIAGLNQGSAKDVTTTILNAKGTAERGTKAVTGVNSVGGIFGANSTSTAGIVQDCINYNELKILTPADGSVPIKDFGGIVGFNDSESKIDRCQNRSFVFLEKGNAKPERIENIGGIAGRNKGVLQQCQNNLEVSKGIKDITDESMAAIKTGKLPVYSGVNVGGITGHNEKLAKVNDCTANNATTGYRVVGGLIGKNQGSFSDTPFSGRNTGNAPDAEGVVVATGDTAGGIVGSNTNNDIKGYHNSTNVFAGSVAGGITGANGGNGKYSFRLSSGDSNYYNELVAPGFESVDKTMAIVNCENYGFVYALSRYSGGIAGVNYGSIANSNSMVEVDKIAILSGKLGVKNYPLLARADAVGGIAGCNLGSISGGNAQYKSVISELYGKDCVGGIVGLNNGLIENYPTVEGNIYGNGNSIGGFAGMNLNGASLSNLAFNDGSMIYGGYFVGGIIGCNVADGVTETRVNGASTQTTSRRGKITGTAYVGGIVGYQTTIKGSLAQLASGELKNRVANAFAPYTPQTEGTASDVMTMFANCINRSEVSAARYVGGIIGYNSEASALLVTQSTNYGKIAVQEKAGSVTDGFYFIGGITGRNSSGGVLDQCINDGSVISPSMYLGGICEVNEGYIQFCSIGKSKNYNEEGISGSHSVGGLVGLNSKNIVRCSTSPYAKISGGNNTGGLAGTNDSRGIITGDISYAWIRDGINSDIAQSSDVLCTSSGSVVGGNNTGGIVGQNGGRVQDVSVENATISGNSYVGGFIGNNIGQLAGGNNQGSINRIEGLSNRAKKVTGIDQVGGIVGKHNAALIEDCINFGVVEATGDTGYAGGVTGSVESGITISDCTNYGTVISNNSQAGGIAGNNKGNIESCKNYGSVTGAMSVKMDTAVGGIAGINENGGTVVDCISGDNQNDPDIAQNINSNTPNAIRGIYVVGGMVGVNRGTLKNENQGSEVTVNITIAENKLNGTSRVGGVIGDVYDGCRDTMKGYTYAGTIHTPEKASQQQYVGGIIGQLLPDMTLENCTFDGKITGYGNESSQDCGIGGLAGFSNGTVLVYPDKDGIYSSNTEKSSITGSTNVGGIAGIVEERHRIYLKKDGSAVELSQIPENNDQDTKNDIYYVNRALVSGFNQAGGFYGRIRGANNSTLTLSFCQNGLPGNSSAGIIRPNSLKSQNAQSIGGIVGSINNANNKQVEISNVKNYGQIGENDTYMLSADTIGGIVGNSQNSAGARITRAYNYGSILCGASDIGGIAGKATNTVITDSYNEGVINTKSSTTGGIAGTLNNSSITASGGTEGRILNKAAITVTGNTTNIGGIAGLLSGTSSIKNVENSGKVTYIRGISGNTNVGGIAGRITGAPTLDKCKNTGDLILQQVYLAGGIVGSINASPAVVKDCTNAGAVNSALQDAGGIAGKIEVTQKLTFTGNVNEKEGIVSVKYRGGGIIGTINTSSGAAWVMSDCTNYAPIHVGLPKGSVNKEISQIGGCVGYSLSSAQISKFVNHGAIVANRKEIGSTVSQIDRVGGVFGIIDSTASTVALECENYGDFEFLLESNATKLQKIGGVAGEILNKTVLDTCSNAGKIDFEKLSKSPQDSIGGLTGRANKNTKLLYCKNTGSVLGSTENSQNVGGLAGYSEGLVYSSRTELAADGSGIVQGKTNVGGLVGNAASADCKISSIVNRAGTGYEISQNTFKVMGQEAVGGVVGYQKGATIYTVMNTSTAEVVLLKKNTNKNSSISAGGITGKAEFDGTIPGVIADCYGFGQVRFQDKSSTYYLGGIAGHRESTSKTQAGVSIKDSFYLYDNSTHEIIDSSKPDTGVPEAVLAVGNEPEGSYTADVEDQQYGDVKDQTLSTPDRFRWSKEAYEKMYRALKRLEPDKPVPDADLWDDLDTVLKNIVPIYDKYKLPVPQTGNVVSNDAYAYTLPIEKMPGFCSYLEVNLFSEDTPIEDIEAETAVPLLHTEKQVTMDSQLTDVGFDASAIANFEQYVGKVIQVAVKAHGVGEETSADGTIVYTMDSDQKVVQKFILMPMLVKPEVEVVKQEGADLTFRITNWDEYQKSAGEFYESIQNTPELNSLEIYQSLKKGLENFTITDYYLTTANGARNNKIKDVWTITADAVDENGLFAIDYSVSPTFQAQKSLRQYHDWDMQAVAAHKDWSVDADTVIANNYYRYTSSYIENLKYRIEVGTKLKPPTNLTSRYTGDINWENDAATPRYEVSFEKSASPQEAIAGYLITVTNPAKGKTHTYTYVPVEGEELLPCTYVLDKATLMGTGSNQLALDLSPQSQPVALTFTIAAKVNTSEAAKFFTDSENAPGTIPIVKKQFPVEEDMSVTIENENKPNELTFHWNDSHSSGSDVYLVSYQVKQGQTVIQEETSLAQPQRDYKVTLPEDNLEYEITIEVVRQGVTTGTGDSKRVESLNSEKAVYVKNIGKLLKPVEHVTAAFQRVEGDMLYYHLTFDIPPELLPSDCKGFWIQAVNADASGLAINDAIEILFDDQQPIEVKIPVTNAGKSFYIHVISQAADGTVEDSIRAISNLLKIPADKLMAPDTLGAKMTVDSLLTFDLTDKDADNALKMDALEAAVYTFEWNISNPLNVGKQQIDIVSGSSTLYSETTPSNATTLNVLKDLRDYAGQKLKLLVYNLPVDASLSLPSEAAQLDFYVPKIQLVEPVFSALPEAEPVVITQNGTIVTSTTEILEADYHKLTYTVNWLETILQEGRTGTKVSLIMRETDNNGVMRDTLIPFKLISEEDGQPVEVLTGEYTLPFTMEAGDYDANGNPIQPKRTFVLTDIPEIYAGKNLVIQINTTTDTAGVPSEVYLDSIAEESIFGMPKMK